MDDLREQTDMHNDSPETFLHYGEPEEWRPVVGWEGLYEVSDLGRIRSLDKTVARGRKHTVKIFMPARFIGQYRIGRYRNYWGVVLHRDGKRRLRMVHRLVMDAFVGPLPPGLETRHGPAGSLDNCMKNLCYGTPAENTADQFRDGVHPIGSVQVNAVLTEAIVRECRARMASNLARIGELAAEFGVSNQSMSKAVRGKTWKHVPGGVPTNRPRRRRVALLGARR
jgi:hypothetical protein